MWFPNSDLCVTFAKAVSPAQVNLFALFVKENVSVDVIFVGAVKRDDPCVIVGEWEPCTQSW